MFLTYLFLPLFPCYVRTFSIKPSLTGLKRIEVVKAVDESVIDHTSLAFERIKDGV